MTSAFNWRAIFWFLCITSGLSVISFALFFRDTFRRERSLTYQNLLDQRRKAVAHAPIINDKKISEKNTSKRDTPEQHKEAALDFNLSLVDVNPLKPLGQVLRRKNNIIVLISSGNKFFSIYDLNTLTNVVCRIPVWI